MAIKSYFLDKRVLKTPTSTGSLINLKNLLDLKEYILDVIGGYSELDTLTVGDGVNFTLSTATIQTDVVTNGLNSTNNLVLPDGKLGQIKIVSLKTKTAGGDNVAVHPTHQLGSISTLATAGIDTIVLMYTTFGWMQLNSVID